MTGVRINSLSLGGQESAMAGLGIILLTCGDYHYPKTHDQVC